jgi:hypothetical protein
MAETASQFDQPFTQDEFGDWVNERRRSDINHDELLNGRLVLPPPARRPHGCLAPRVLPSLALGINDVPQL